MSDARGFGNPQLLLRIHQPSAELFQVFDRLLLLRKGGETVYFGDLGHNSTTLLSYFERNGSRPCGPEENPCVYNPPTIFSRFDVYSLSSLGLNSCST